MDQLAGASVVDLDGAGNAQGELVPREGGVAHFFNRDIAQVPAGGRDEADTGTRPNDDAAGVDRERGQLARRLGDESTTTNAPIGRTTGGAGQPPDGCIDDVAVLPAGRTRRTVAALLRRLAARLDGEHKELSVANGRKSCVAIGLVRVGGGLGRYFDGFRSAQRRRPNHGLLEGRPVPRLAPRGSSSAQRDGVGRKEPVGTFVLEPHGRPACRRPDTNRRAHVRTAAARAPSAAVDDQRGAHAIGGDCAYRALGADARGHLVRGCGPDRAERETPEHDDEEPCHSPR